MKKLLLLSLFPALLLGCEDTDDNNDTTDTGTSDTSGPEVITCETAFTACGGDPVGTWNVTGACDPDLSVDSCPDATYAIDVDRTSGTISINADGSFERAYHYDLDFAASIPSSCLMGLDCAQVPAVTDGIFSSCAQVGADCECEGTYTEDDEESGTWTGDGTTLTFNAGDPVEYCIDGDSGHSVHPDGARVIWQR